MVSGKSGCCSVHLNIISNGVIPVEARTAKDMQIEQMVSIFFILQRATVTNTDDINARESDSSYVQ